MGLWQARNESFVDIAETEQFDGQLTNATGRGRSTTRKGESPTKSSVKQSGNKSSMIQKEEMQLEKIK